MRFALAAKKLPYEMVTVNLLKGEQTSGEHIARSPTGQVPCLMIGGRAIIESVAIIELLESIYPEPALYPTDPWKKAQVRIIVEMINSGIQPLQNLKVLERVSADPAARKEWGAHFNAKGLEALEALLEIYSKEGIRGKYTYGDSLTAADAFLLPQVYSAKRFDVDVAKFPRVQAASDAIMETEAARASLPENQPDAVK